MINRLNFFQLKQNSPIKRENIAFKAQSPSLKADTVELKVQNIDIINNRLNQLDKTYSQYLPWSTRKQGIGIVKELIKHSDLERVSRKFILQAKQFNPTTFDYHLDFATKYGFNETNPYSVLESESNDVMAMMSSYVKTYKNFIKRYIEQMPLNLFKAELLTIANNLDNKSPKSAELLKKLRQFGLNSEVKKWAQKIESDFNLTITPFNDVSLLKSTYEELAIHKKYFKNMPAHIDMIDFNRFYDAHKKSLAIYDSTPKHIELNPVFVFLERFKGENNNLMNCLKHELGHHIDLSNLRNSRIDFNKLLDESEISLLKRLTPEYVDTSTIVDESKKMMIDDVLKLTIETDGKYNTNIYYKIDILYDNITHLPISLEDKKLLGQISDKIVDTKTILGQFYNKEDVAQLATIIENDYGKRALSSSKELIAYAFEKSVQKHPSSQMQEVLDIFGMPKLTDRCVLPKPHSVFAAMDIEKKI